MRTDPSSFREVVVLAFCARAGAAESIDAIPKVQTINFNAWALPVILIALRLAFRAMNNPCLNYLTDHPKGRGHGVAGLLESGWNLRIAAHWHFCQFRRVQRLTPGLGRGLGDQSPISRR
jgi:hypothetical protein